MSRTWEREVSAQIRAIVGLTPLVAVAFEDGNPVCGPLGDAALAGGRARPAPTTPLAGGRLPYDDDTQSAMLVSFIGSGMTGEHRKRLLREAGRVLTPAGRLLVLDHNRPRGRLAAIGALIAAPRLPGDTLGARWRRLGHQTAREAQAEGFVVEALRLAGGEGVQLVVARAAGDA